MSDSVVIFLNQLIFWGSICGICCLVTFEATREHYEKIIIKQQDALTKERRKNYLYEKQRRTTGK